MLMLEGAAGRGFVNLLKSIVETGGADKLINAVVKYSVKYLVTNSSRKKWSVSILGDLK